MIRKHQFGNPPYGTVVIDIDFSVKWNGKKMSVQQWTVTCNLATGGKAKTQTVHGAVHKVIFKGALQQLLTS